MAGPKKVLIVDDEMDLRSIVRLTLQGAGYQVAEAMNGRQALGELEREQPDLMILDIMMPKMNGIELCRAMIDKLEIKDLPVLVLSAINEKSKIIEEFFSLPLGTKSFLRKPVETAEMLSRVREMIGEAGSGGGAPAGAASAETSPKPKPAASAGPAPASAPKAAEATGPSYRVLVIDDEEDIRALLRATLTMRHTVELAENGMDALEKIDDFNPDFVLSDINMPVMNGLETVEAIRQHPKFHDIPVFFLTGEKDAKLPEKAFGLGANLFLRKPIDPMQLLKTVDYFVKEAQLMPKPVMAPAPAKAAAAARAAGQAETVPAAPVAAGGGRVRVLTVDENPDTTAVLRKAMPESAKAPWETLWTAEVQTALGNLKRWEPDVIFYNPRNTRMDGIAFVQSLRLKKLDKHYKIVFTGANFFDADLTYSQRNLGHDVMRLDAGESKVASMVGAVIDSVRGKVKPKRAAVVDIEAEHESVRQREAADRKKAEKQREIFRDRFARIQNFIDSSHRHD